MTSTLAHNVLIWLFHYFNKIMQLLTPLQPFVSIGHKHLFAYIHGNYAPSYSTLSCLIKITYLHKIRSFQKDKAGQPWILPTDFGHHLQGWPGLARDTSRTWKVRLGILKPDNSVDNKINLYIYIANQEKYKYITPPNMILE